MVDRELSGGHKSHRAMEGISPFVVDVLHPKHGGEDDFGSVPFIHLKKMGLKCLPSLEVIVERIGEIPQRS